jgi:2',3'-cyclic-nucleotide 2'-phosphodiesterase (5'-nucleotidase family)
MAAAKKLVKIGFKETKDKLKDPVTHKSEPPNPDRSVAAKVQPWEEEAEAYLAQHIQSLSRR